ncbi:MAG: phenylalanine--tRNA ligase subunit alpha, partial [Paracraurococcus sp.]
MSETTKPGDDLAALEAETAAALDAAGDLRAWDAVRVGILGKSGRLTALLKGLGQVPAEQRRERGAALNRLKTALEARIEARRTALEAAALAARLAAERLDVTLPPRPHPPAGAEAGGIHPISRTMEELVALFGA